MKPLNLDNSPCSPISSNCVIWQGPDIACIKLCKGDTVSDVVFKLATELCEILEILDIKNYNLSCFNLTSCAPADFQALINFLIERICALENLPNTGSGTPSSGECPTECMVQVAPCLATSPNQTLSLIDYVNLIATTLCNAVTNITILQAAVNSLDIRVTVLEDAPPPVFTIPTVATTCTIGSLAANTYDVEVITQEFLNNVWCSFYAITGTANQISTALSTQCVTTLSLALNSFYTVPGRTIGAEYPTYVNAPATLAAVIGNLWIALCDVRDAGRPLSAVAAGVNTSVSSSISIVGNDELTTYTVDAEISIQNEGAPLTTTPESINFVGELVEATVLGNVVTVAINNLGGMLAQFIPSDLISLPYVLGGAGIICNQPVQVIAEQYDDANAYDPLTGVWTCPATGRYNLSCYAHYTRNTGTGWYDALNPGGMFGIGVHTTTGCNIYCGDYMTVMGIQKHIDISSQAIGVIIPAGTQLSVKVINQTGYDYTSTAGDVIRFSIERIK